MANDLWRTPEKVFRAYNNSYPFVADLACDEGNKLCPVGLTESMNSLRCPWGSLLNSLNGWGWCNPPYSNPLPWVEKAVYEQTHHGAPVFMLLNADTSVRWFRTAFLSVSEIHNYMSNLMPERAGYRNGRIGFINEHGEANRNNKPQVGLLFDPARIGARQTKYFQLDEIYNNETLKTAN